MAEITASTSRGEDKVEPVRDASNSEADRTCVESVASGITSEAPSFCTWICTWILTACTRMWGAGASGLSVARFGQRALGCEAQDERESEVSSRIKASMPTWSEVPGRCSVQVQDPNNASVCVELREMAPWFFRDDVGERVEVGRLIAEGGQAEIYEVKFKAWDRTFYCFKRPGSNYVMKVFKLDAGFSLADLKRHWPRPAPPVDDLSNAGFLFAGFMWFHCFSTLSAPWCATLLKDGRFAFVMERYWGDLRTLIDLRVDDNTHPWEFHLLFARGRQQPLFSFRETLSIMYEIAEGMKFMHKRRVWHRDLKAANVLVQHEGISMPQPFQYACHVADYECAMFVEGTGFWRAPKVLQELQQVSIYKRDWKVDIYSYGMTCYEILTGEIPFARCTKNKWDDVIKGERPPLPHYVDPRLRDLVEKCWHSKQSLRPRFS